MIPFDYTTDYQVRAVNFGDKRLTYRLLSSYAQMEKRGFSKSFPDIFRDTRELKRFYELMNNDKVSPQRFNDSYLNGLVDYFCEPSHRDGVDYLFNYQDTTFGKYNKRKVSLGYTETKDSNGVIIHSGILTGSDYIPIGIAHQLQIMRHRSEFGKRTERFTKDFEEKESYKWADGLHWAKRFNNFINIEVVQVADRECDIAGFFNLAFQLEQHFLVRSMHNRTIKGSEQKLATFIGEQEVAFGTKRSVLDSKGKTHLVDCTVKYAQVHFKDIDQPIWIVHLQAICPPPGLEQTNWTLLTNLPLQQGPSMVNKAIDAYTKRWRTTEDFHKCLKSGCGIEQRQFVNTTALLNVISLMSIAAVRLLRTRHMAEKMPDAPISKTLNEEEEIVALALAEKFLKPVDLDYCTPRTILWWTLLLGRMGGHMGYSQKGMPGWIVLAKGWQYFNTVLDGIKLSKNIYDFHR